MASNLFDTALRILRKSLRGAFAKTELGRTLREADTARRRGRFDEREKRLLKQKLARLSTQQVADELVEALASGGRLGSDLSQLLEPGRATNRVSRARELEAIANLARPLLRPLPGWSQFRQREAAKHGEITDGEMIPVSSSNVHSIGFRLDQTRRRTDRGTLLIRFLGTSSDGHRAGPGPLYEYFDVPTSLFLSFSRAASKGKFVWDSVRVRGTVSGHRFRYELAGISQGYVPRQAGLKRGQKGEWFLTRQFRDPVTGRLVSSQLPEERVRRGSDLRGRPNRGR